MTEDHLEEFLVFNECSEWGQEFIAAIKQSTQCLISSIHTSSAAAHEHDYSKRLIFAMMCANSSIDLLKSIEDSLKLKLFELVKDKEND